MAPGNGAKLGVWSLGTSVRVRGIVGELLGWSGFGGAIPMPVAHSSAIVMAASTYFASAS